MSQVFDDEFLKKGLWDLVDEAFNIDLEIKNLKKEHIEKLEEKLKLVKGKIEREMEYWEVKEIKWELWKAVWVHSNRKSLDDDWLCLKFGITASDKAEFEKIIPIKFIKIGAKK